VDAQRLEMARSEAFGAPRTQKSGIVAGIAVQRAESIDPNHSRTFIDCLPDSNWIDDAIVAINYPPGPGPEQ
jgi:hypothetical protein